ncbi:unnamed protein product, partial [Amoebophrya sp. A120]
ADKVDRFLRDSVFFKPLKNFVGVDKVTFSALSGIGFPDGQSLCKLDVFVQVYAVYDDDGPQIYLNTAKMINSTETIPASHLLNAVAITGRPYEPENKNFYSIVID